MKSKKIKAAPEALREAMPIELPKSIKPAAQAPSIVVKEMFGSKKKPTASAVKVPAVKVPTVLTAPPPKAPLPKAIEAVVEEDSGATEQEVEGVAETETATESLLDVLESQQAPETIQGNAVLGEELEELAVLIKQEEKKDLYGTAVPAEYVPQTRRGFSEFIKLQFKPYILSDQMKVNPKEKFYKYQEFVRDYMRNAAPYRGILVYHGLGSGKTCTSIAAAEALYATSKKNIIVMSPKSLKKNFLREVSACGFRHFQLKNFWLKLSKEDQTAVFFATSVLGVSVAHLKKARNIWVPDFRKSQDESNYASLTPEDRQEIRAQILSIVEWDPKTNPTGRIRFISYNGITAKNLMIMSCDPSYKKFFDDAVIIVDEIHNLIRTIHGTIEPYIIDVKEGVKGVRKLPPEPITPDRWDPALQMRKNLELLLSESKEEKAARKFRKEKIELYSRGYMFYRLLCDARHSKIIGLSGTPLINHPEEIGILSNVLHGYFTMIDAVVDQTGEAVKTQVKALAMEHPLIDFVDAKQDPTGGGIRLTLSLLPEGTIKVSHDTGVMHIPTFTETDVYAAMYAAISSLYEDGKMPAKEEVVGALRSEYEETEFPPFEDVQREILELYTTGPGPSKKQLMDSVAKVYATAYSAAAVIRSLEKGFKAAGIPFRSTPIARAESLLPPLADDYKTNGRAYKGFRSHFIPNKVNLINKATLVTRLTGLISFYKGSSLELMPRVERDEVVRVPMSDYVQRAYSEKRVEELKKELEEDKGQTVDKAWKAVFDMKDTAQSSNFKMGSRQACNFAFPPEVARPRPVNKQEEELEALEGVEQQELVTLAEEIPGEKDEFPELSEEADAEAEEEDATVMKGGVKTLKQIKAEKAAAAAAAAPVAPVPLAAKAPETAEDVDIFEALQALEAPEASGPEVAEIAEPEDLASACKVGRKPGERMDVAIKRATDCFRNMSIAGKRLLLTGDDGLSNYSPKYVAMLERIAAAPGSSLVYSAFLNLEGIGLFRVAMDMNGYAAISFTMTGGQLAFTPEAEKSLRLGPGKQPRYLTFSGKEDDTVRAAALSIFNAQFSELPESMTIILKESGFTDNKVGELCRVFCITSAGAEGLSLRNVRAVHVMEPYWNEVRVRQVKGRAIRIGSHLDLPPEDRNVSIYTYVSVFSDEAQSNKVPAKRIDQSILIHDSINAQTAIDMAIEVKPGTTSYVVSTDEFFYSVSERKRRVIEAIECILKSAAVDCEINIRKNKDTTFMCLPLKGRTGDYVYNPDLEIDILNVPQFEGIDMEKICTGQDVSTAMTEKAKAEAAAKAAAKAAAPITQDFFQKVNKVYYRMRPVMGPDGTPLSFQMYEVDQLDRKKPVPEKLLGTTGVREGKPGPPVKMI